MSSFHGKKTPVRKKGDVTQIFTISSHSIHKPLSCMDSNLAEGKLAQKNKQICPEAIFQLESETVLKGEVSSQTEPIFSSLITNDSVCFIVGKKRKLVIGQKSKMADISEVFSVMLNATWRSSETVIEIPDISPEALDSLLRYATGSSSIQLTDCSVWDLLKAADKYQVLPVIRHCFHFLLHSHSASGKARHVCDVMELAHRLNQSEYHQMSFNIAKSKAGDIFSNEFCLQELCYDCLLDLLRADDLGGVDERLVHEGVIAWTRSSCAQQGTRTSEPSWEELRAAAGELVYHVRYLAIPHPALTRLLDESRSASYLLTRDEKDNLLRHGGSMFPRSVRYRRWARVISNDRNSGKLYLKCVKLVAEVTLYVSLVLLFVLLLVFML